MEYSHSTSAQGADESRGARYKPTMSADSAPGRLSSESTVVMAGAKNGNQRPWLNGLHDEFAVCEVNERRALELVLRNLKPDILIVELTLPGLCRVRGLREIRRFSPDTRIIALTDDVSNDEGMLALKAGARGYCSGSIAATDLKKAIRCIEKG